MTYHPAIIVTLILVVAALFRPLPTPSLGIQNRTKPIYQTTGSEGSITGKVTFVGDRPEPRPIDGSADPVCEVGGTRLFTEDAIITRGKLANVLVYVRSGDALEWYDFDAPLSDLSLAHRGCQFVPRVLAMQRQQSLKIVNADATTHNTHFIPKANRDWNQSQPQDAAPIEIRFTNPEVAIPVKDNQHPWEKAFVGVFAHPFFAVSTRDGSYQISGLPPGRYVIVAWHERFGEQSMEVSVGVREQKVLDFAFKPVEK